MQQCPHGYFMNEDKHCQKIDSCKVGIDEKCNDIPGILWRMII